MLRFNQRWLHSNLWAETFQISGFHIKRSKFQGQNSPLPSWLYDLNAHRRHQRLQSKIPQVLDFKYKKKHTYETEINTIIRWFIIEYWSKTERKWTRVTLTCWKSTCMSDSESWDVDLNFMLKPTTCVARIKKQQHNHWKWNENQGTNVFFYLDEFRFFSE